MILTVEEAKNQWCPFARVLNLALVDDARQNSATNPDDAAVVSEGAPHNRLHLEGDGKLDNHAEGTHCLASACMAWQWHEPTAEDLDMCRPGERPPVRGYCGLAGRPLP